MQTFAFQCDFLKPEWLSAIATTLTLAVIVWYTVCTQLLLNVARQQRQPYVILWWKSIAGSSATKYVFMLKNIGSENAFDIKATIVQGSGRMRQAVEFTLKNFDCATLSPGMTAESGTFDFPSVIGSVMDSVDRHETPTVQVSWLESPDGKRRSSSQTVIGHREQFPQ